MCAREVLTWLLAISTAIASKTVPREQAPYRPDSPQGTDLATLSEHAGAPAAHDPLSVPISSPRTAPPSPIAGRRPIRACSQTHETRRPAARLIGPTSRSFRDRPRRAATASGPALAGNDRPESATAGPDPTARPQTSASPVLRAPSWLRLLRRTIALPHAGPIPLPTSGAGEKCHCEANPCRRRMGAGPGRTAAARHRRARLHPAPLTRPRSPHIAPRSAPLPSPA